MASLRRFLLRNRLAGVLLVAAALALRILVPAGFMPTVASGRIVVKICNESGTGPTAMVLDVPGLEHKQPPIDSAHGKCAYADLAQAIAGGADPILFAAALAFVLALAFTRRHPPLAMTARRLRPPLRGPPARR